MLSCLDLLLATNFVVEIERKENIIIIAHSVSPIIDQFSETVLCDSAGVDSEIEASSY